MSRKLSLYEIKAACKRQGILYEDRDFTATDDNIFYSRKSRHFEWKRPKELSSDPKFLLGRPSRFDIQLGLLDDSWLMSAVASAATYLNILGDVVPNGQDFNDPDYCGAFQFNFWFQGEWVEIIVDDRLPTDGEKLVFVHSENPDVFWSALFEKAYAKLHGSYEALKGGKTGDAIVDLTGRLVETIDLTKVSKPDEIYKRISLNTQQGQLMGCSIKAEPEGTKKVLDNGLVTNHGFTVTGAAKVRETLGEKHDLVRVRNPWGNKREWKGAFGDESEQWRKMTGSEHKRIGLTYEDDGEFWMTFEDFKENFTTLEMPVRTGDFETVYHGSWKKGVSAGGCRNFLDTFHTNPQMVLEVEKKQIVTIALLQKDCRKNKQRGKMSLKIGFVIYKIPEKNEASFDGKLDKEFFRNNLSAEKSDFLDDREVFKTFDLERGKYVIVPSTFDPNQNGHFLLRVYKEKGRKIFRNMEEEEPEESRYIGRLTEPLSNDEQAKFNDAFYATFKDVAGTDESVDAFELQAILNTSFKDVATHKFPLSTCWSIIKHYDTSNSLTLEYKELKTAWMDLMTLKNAMSSADNDKNKSIDESELINVFQKFDIPINVSLRKMLMGYYTDKEGRLPFDGVIDIILTVRRLTDNYEKFIERKERGVRKEKRSAQMTLDEFLMNAIAR